MERRAPDICMSGRSSSSSSSSVCCFHAIMTRVRLARVPLLKISSESIMGSFRSHLLDDANDKPRRNVAESASRRIGITRPSITRENIRSEACSRIKRVIIKYGTLNSIVYPHIIPWKIHFSPNLKTPSGPLNIICYRVCYFLLFHLLLAIFRVPSFLA